MLTGLYTSPFSPHYLVKCTLSLGFIPSSPKFISGKQLLSLMPFSRCDLGSLNTFVELTDFSFDSAILRSSFLKKWIQTSLSKHHLIMKQHYPYSWSFCVYISNCITFWLEDVKIGDNSKLSIFQQLFNVCSREIIIILYNTLC